MPPTLTMAVTTSLRRCADPPCLLSGQSEAGQSGAGLACVADIHRGLHCFVDHDRPGFPIGEDEEHRGA